MRYGSVCSGIESATVAWNPLGWEAEWFSQYDPDHNYDRGMDFPSTVLEHHYPGVPNIGDMTRIEEREEYGRSIELLVGGTPCQSFSIAGLREGLGDERGNLALKFCKILRDKQPRWFIWENVPGVLSSNRGRDFAAILSGFRECGYGFAYRVLDAQYFGVAQRRRRVFVVGYLGDWRPAGAVLFERNSLYGDPPPCRKARERLTKSIGGSVAGNVPDSGNPVIIDRAAFNQGENALYDPKIDQGNLSPALVARGPHAVGHRMLGFGEYVADETASTIKMRDYKDSTDLVCVHGTQDPDVRDNQAHTLGRNRGQDTPMVMYENHMQDSRVKEVDVSPTISAKAGTGGGNLPLVQTKMVVRRLTPIECERLQGFPDNYTRISWRGKPVEECPDGHRYMALGNSMAVPVMHWLGKRVDMVDKIVSEL